MNVTVSQLEAKANELETLNTNFRNQVSEMEASEEALRGMWEGEANAAFHNAFVSDKIQMQNFYNAIAMYVYKLREIARRYQNAEQKNHTIATERTYH